MMKAITCFHEAIRHMFNVVPINTGKLGRVSFYSAVCRSPRLCAQCIENGFLGLP